MEFAKQYYGCDDIQGVYLENQGGSGTARLVNTSLCHVRLEIMKCVHLSYVALIGKEEHFSMK